MNRKVSALLAIAVVLVLVGIVVSKTQRPVSYENKQALIAETERVASSTMNVATSTPTQDPKTISFGVNTLNVTYARNMDQTALGLSGRAGLAPNEGLVFVFATSSRWGIWMKDMKFPIDIVWLDKEGKVIHLKERVSPDTFPEVYTPPTPALYVIETAAGTVRISDLKLGDTVDVSRIPSSNPDDF